MVSLNILDKKLYKRKMLAHLIAWIKTEHILLITGSRQVGKTSLLYLLIQHLVESGANKQNIFYFDLEDFDLLEVCNQGPQHLENFLVSQGMNSEEQTWLFIDEIQYLDNPSNFLKLLHDHHKNIKTFCSGSSTLDIKRKFQDSLVGRKIVFELFPLSFSEFLLFQNQESLVTYFQNYKIINFLNNQKVEAPINIMLKNLNQYFNEYIQFGGYPAITKISEYEMKATLLNELYQTYVRKDINQLFTISNVTSFNTMVRLLAFQIGQLVNLKEIATSISINRQAVQNNLFILENTFILKMLQPFFTNKRNELIKMPKIYFHDTGLRNQIVKNLNSPEHRNDAGALVENFVFQQLHHSFRSNQALKFWRSQNKNEVDFIIESDQIIPIEVKYKSFNSPQIPQGIRFFIEKYDCKHAFVITKDYFEQIRKNDCTINFIPVPIFNY